MSVDQFLLSADTTDLNYPEIRPTLDLNFARTKTLDPRIIFTRASGGSYVGADGLIKYAGVNEARFDHDPTTGESLGLLVEESRTNLVLQSQTLTTSPWSDNSATTSPASTITDVFGGTSASFKLTEDNTNSAHFVGQAFTLAASTSYSVTVWFKQGSANRDGRILLTNAAIWDGSATPRARIEFSTGTVQNVLGFTSTSLASYSNGWYRFTGTALTGSSGTSALRLFVSDATEIYQGDGTSYIYVGPCQLEEGSFPTSYIPTTTATVTRAADVAGISGSNFSSWYRQDEGTVFVDFSVEGVYGTSGFNRSFVLYDSTSADRFRLLQVGTNASFYESWIINGSQNMNFNVFNISYGKTIRYSSAYKQNDFQRYALDANNTLDSNIDTSIDVGSFTADSLSIGVEKTGSNQLNGHIARLTYFPKRLPNEQLIALTR